MAKPYTVNINNGVGTEELLNDTYTVTASATGYDNLSIDPNSIAVDENSNTYNFTIAATGSLIIHVTEEGTAGGTNVSNAKFIRCDSTGNTTYGSEITTDTSGAATLPNLPFAATNAPIVYYKQTSSDGEHEYSTAVRNINLTLQETTEEVQNARPQLRTINLTDENYTGLPIATAQITLS